MLNCYIVTPCKGVWREGAYRIARMFCEHQTFVNFAMVNQFPTIKSAKSKLVNTHDPCQNAIVRLQRVNFLLIWLIRKGFSPAKYSSNTWYIAAGWLVHCMHGTVFIYTQDHRTIEPAFKVPCKLIHFLEGDHVIVCMCPKCGLLLINIRWVDCGIFSNISGLPLEKRWMSWGSTVYSLHCTITFMIIIICSLWRFSKNAPSFSTPITFKQPSCRIWLLGSDQLNSQNSHYYVWCLQNIIGI